MTKKIHVHLVDDLDASEASETVRFEVDGRTYEIDLSSRNARRFRTEIAPYITHARRVITHARRRGRAGTGSVPPRAAGRPRGAAPGPAAGRRRTSRQVRQASPAMMAASPPRADFGGAVLDGRPAGADFGDEEHSPS